MYTLYAIEIFVLITVILARRDTKHFVQDGKQNLTEAENKTNAEIEKRRTTASQSIFEKAFNPVTTGLSKVADAVTDGADFVLGT